MTDELASGFLSYARSDDEREAGRITRLAKRIMDEFETLTGQKLNIFIDSEGIEWGDGMRRKLDEALQETTFFIPVLTPTYFVRDECRLEMLKFVNSAKALGLEELLMSIRYVRVPDLREDSADELKAVAAGMQYVDWTELRLLDENKTEYLTAVNKLAQRLVDLTHALEVKPAESRETPLGETATGSARYEEDEDPEAPGLIDLLVEFQPKADAWLETLNDLPTSMNAFSAPFNEATADMNRHTGKDAFAYRIARSRELARTVEEPLQRYEQVTKDYSARLLDLDPSVRAFLEMAELTEHTEWAGANPIESLLGLVKVSRDSMNSTSYAADQARKLSRTSRDLRPVLRRFEAATRNVSDAQTILDGWESEIASRGLAPRDNEEGEPKASA